jgi:MshEN domain
MRMLDGGSPLAERLGEYLVKAGKITEPQLSSVLERQVTMGGRLGTNLMELGLLSENDLTQFLSKQLNIPSVRTADLDQIDPSLIQLIPRDLAQKYYVVPIKRDRTRLSVALLDPTDLEMLDELRFITGCIIKPYIASEARIRYVLERYYQISRELRYVSVLNDERKRHGLRSGAEAEKSGKKGPSLEDVNAAMNQAKENWVEVRDRDQAIGTFLRAVNVVLDRGILMLVKSGTVTGWRAFPVYRETEIGRLEFKLDQPSLFKDVVEAKTFYQGPAPYDPTYRDLFQLLGGEYPKEILLLPILINDQVVAVLYGDNQTSGSPIQSLPYVRKLSQKVAMALEILILKKKIMEL